ncbi:MAG: hypothetical protein MUF62_03530 [Chitinophagaceae bacterium]|jgi:hypothetical protein|nr:hypothetical protein [Chitinophagaceae bacterium]
MAINKNHPFEELSGVKCAVVEASVSQERVDFLRPLLELNGYEVIVAATPPPKAAAKPAAEEAAEAPAAIAPVLFTIGVTDVTFNATNAVFGRLLKTKEGKVVTQAYWLQKEAVSDDETPYYEKGHLFKR